MPYIKNPAPVVNAPVASDDEDDHENDKWNPTPAIFEGFLARDMELAQRNVLMALSTSPGRAMSLRDLKDCLLHSVDTIERVLTSHIVSGLVKQDMNGRYERVANVRGR
jgi:hypothetical protein